MCMTKIDLRKLRKNMNLTQVAFAKKIGVNKHTIWRWEHYGVPKSGSTPFLLQQLYQESLNCEIKEFSKDHDNP